MKRKRGAGKRKSNKPSTGGASEVFVEPGYYSDRNEENDEVESITEIETRAVHTKLSGQHTGLDNPATNNETVTGAVAKLARAISSSHVNPINNIVSQQRERIGQKEPKSSHQEPKSSHQEPVYNKQELDAALTVIKKIMKMEAAAPFNAPVDPIALGIPDYFDIIDTPMDFGTICSKLESGLKYRKSEEVFKDVELIWDNCCKYNRKGSLILELMKRIKTTFKRQWTAAGLHREQSTATTGHLCHNPQPCQVAVHMDPVGSTISSSAHLQQHNLTVLKQRPFQKLSACSTHNFEPQEMSYHCHCSLNSGQLQPGLHQHDMALPQTSFPHLHPGDLMNGKCCSQRVSEANPSLSHSCQPSPSCSLMAHHHQRGCMHQSSLCRLPPSQIEAGTNSQSAGHLHLPHREPTSTFTKCNAFNLVRDAEDRYHQQQCQMDSAHMQAYDPSASCMPVHHLNQSTCQQLLSSHAKGPRNSDCGGTVQVPPSTVLTGNCTKPTTECPRPPVTDDTSCRELNQINPTPEQSSSMMNIMACHPVEKSCQNHPESSPSEHLHSTADNNFFKRITRGHTQIQCQEQSSSMMNSQKHQHQENTSKIPTISPESQPLPATADHNRKWQRKSGGQEPTDGTAFGGDRIPIPTNAQGQPVGPHAQKLVSFLGTLARNGHFLPLTYLDWRHVPSEKKKNMWEKVQLRFDIDPTSKDWVLQSLGRRWKDWKSKLKTAHYYPHETDEERLADCDERILPDQWAALVKLWSTESAQKNSATNRANRMKAKYIHASGRKSFARIREEQRNRPDGKELSRAELFILTRTRKDGKPVNEASSEVIKKLQHQINGQDTPQDSNKQGDVLSQIIGSDKRGRTRCIELGIELDPTYPPDLGGPKPACSESTRMVSESDANAEIRDLKEKMAVMEKTCTQMVSQMAALVSMVSSMHKNTPDKNVPNMVANTSCASDHPAAQAVDTRSTTRGASTRQTRRSKRNI